MLPFLMHSKRTPQSPCYSLYSSIGRSPQRFSSLYCDLASSVKMCTITSLRSTRIHELPSAPSLVRSGKPAFCAASATSSARLSAWRRFLAVATTNQSVNGLTPHISITEICSASFSLRVCSINFSRSDIQSLLFTHILL